MVKEEEEISSEKDDEVMSDPNNKVPSVRRGVSFDEKVSAYDNDIESGLKMPAGSHQRDADLTRNQDETDLHRRRVSSKVNENCSNTPPTDMETGKKGSVRFHHASVSFNYVYSHPVHVNASQLIRRDSLISQVRSYEEAVPQSHGARTKRHLLNFFTFGKSHSNKAHSREEIENDRINHISSHGRFFVSTPMPRHDGSDTSDSSMRPRQYRLEAIRVRIVFSGLVSH